MTSDRPSPEQVLQSILQNVQVGGNLTTGDISQILNLFVSINQPESFNPTGIPQNIPSSGTIKFVGRSEELERLHQMLQQNNQVVIAAIAGMGGVGKTELATQYALLHWLLRTYPGGICWLRARDEDIGIQLVRFAEAKLGLKPPEDWDLPSQVEFCWSRWCDGDVLVVVDDVNDYSRIKPYLPPQQSRFKALITTRLQLDLPQSLTLDVLGEAAALDLLRQWVGSQKIDQQLLDAKELCQRLGYLPLALNLVGRYVKKRKLPLAKMLRRLEEKGLRHQSLDVDKNERTWTFNIKRGVAAAFELSWEELSEKAKQLGCLLSLFALAPIIWDLVENVETELDPEALEDARVELENLHLLQGEEIYHLHQLIREFFREKLEKSEQADELKRAFAAATASAAEQIPPITTHELLQTVCCVMPHIAEASTVVSNLLAQMEDSLRADYLGYLYSREIYQRAMSFDRFSQGLRKYIKEIIFSYPELDRYLARYVKAFKIYEEWLGAEHPNIIKFHSNIEVIFREMKQDN